MVRDQAKHISFKNKEQNPDSFLEHFHAFAGRVGLVWARGIGRVGPIPLYMGFKELKAASYTFRMLTASNVHQ